jgi:hypothetical protein
LSHQHAGTEHILLGILREEQCIAAQFLIERGLRLDAIRDELAQTVLDRQALIASIKPNNLPEAGVVPDADTAIRIAEVIWRPLYGLDAIDRQKPYKAELQSGRLWIVTGTSPTQGTAPLSTVIAKEDGRILAIGPLPSSRHQHT